MDGPSPGRRSEQARRFAEQLIARSSAGAQSWRAARLGPRTLNLGIRDDDPLSEFIRDAFLPGREAPGMLELSVTRAGDLDRLPPLEWAREWIDTGRIVPIEVTYPYRVFFDRQVGIVYALDQMSGRGAVWVRRDRELDLRSFITPFRLMLSWLANLFDAEVVHASAAAVDGQALLMSGASGSGKSTLAIALGMAGHGFIADDCVLLHGDAVYAVYSRAKLDGRAETLLGSHGLDLQRLAATPRSKGFFRVEDLGGAFVAEHHLGALGFPVLSTTTGHYRLPQRRAYRMLSADSLREIFGGGARNRLRLATAVRRHPAYRVLLSTSMEDNVAAIRAVSQERAELDPLETSVARGL